MQTIRGGAAVGAIALAVGLSGCVVFGAETSPPPVSTPNDAATDLETAPLPAWVSVAPGTVAARGDFSSSSGVSGHVQVVRDTAGYRLDVEALGLPADGQSYSLVVWPTVPTPPLDCAQTPGWLFDQGPVSSGDSTYGPYPDTAVPLLADPTFIAGVAVQRMPPPGERGADCDGGNPSVLGWAALEWSLPDLRPDVRPADRGPSNGARGELLDSLYWVADGDTYDAIADRFGVTIEGLDYLNPLHPYGDRPDELMAGCTLNIDKAHRGHPENCAWYD